VVATDDERIAAAVRAFGGEVALTRADHQSGTDRVAEVAAATGAELVVNVQGDEPLLDPKMIDECVTALKDAIERGDGVGMATVLKAVGESVFHDPDVVKVVTDARGRALYFSRSLIPYPRQRTDAFEVYEHIASTPIRAKHCSVFPSFRPAAWSRSNAWSSCAPSRTASAFRPSSRRARASLFPSIRSRTWTKSAASWPQGSRHDAVVEAIVGNSRAPARIAPRIDAKSFGKCSSQHRGRQAARRPRGRGHRQRTQSA